MHADRMTLLAYLRDFKDPEIAEKVLESAEYIHREQAKNQTDDERLQNWRLGYFYAMARYHAGRCRSARWWTCCWRSLKRRTRKTTRLRASTTI